MSRDHNVAWVSAFDCRNLRLLTGNLIHASISRTLPPTSHSACAFTWNDHQSFIRHKRPRRNEHGHTACHFTRMSIHTRHPGEQRFHLPDAPGSSVKRSNATSVFCGGLYDFGNDPLRYVANTNRVSVPVLPKLQCRQHAKVETTAGCYIFPVLVMSMVTFETTARGRCAKVGGVMIRRLY